MVSRKLLILLCLLAGAPPVRAGELIAVLSSAGGAYMEAFSAFQAAYGRPVKFFDLSKDAAPVWPEAGTLVAFGGRAASADYPPALNLVSCMAPGVFAKSGKREGGSVTISMTPEARAIIVRLRQLQPDLRRLQVFWSVAGFAGTIEKLKAEGALLGVEVSATEVRGAAALPALLRGQLGSMDAFWLPPDPLLMTPDNIMLLRDFSWSNGKPFYGSTKGMTRQGAVASVGVRFAEIGAAAAAAAADLEAGRPSPEIVFPDKAELTLNGEAARHCGIIFPRQAADAAYEIFP